MNFVQWSRDKFEAHKRLGFYSNPRGSVVDALIRWKYERQRPWPWHYATRLYRRLVLARKDWRLPWR